MAIIGIMQTCKYYFALRWVYTPGARAMRQIFDVLPTSLPHRSDNARHR